MSLLQIENKVIDWVQEYLCDRHQAVVIENVVSDFEPVTSGVPQGSVLGPTLFLIFINDIHIGINSKIRLFADDCVIYHVVTDYSNCEELDNDLRKLSEWCRDWQMNINTKKTKLMRFTTCNNFVSHTYTINNEAIEPVESFKYLGVHLTFNLTWNTHIDWVIGKSNRTLGFLRRTLRQANKDTRLLAYKSIVRSKLEYCSVIWNPHQAYLTKRLESLQNKAARFIVSDYSSYSSVSKIKDSLDLATLERRRKASRLIFFHKIYHNPTPYTATIITTPVAMFPRLDHSFKVRQPFARTDLLRCSFLHLAIQEWNQLPRSVAEEENADKFSEALNQFLSLTKSH